MQKKKTKKKKTTKNKNKTQCLKPKPINKYTSSLLTNEHASMMKKSFSQAGTGRISKSC